MTQPILYSTKSYTMMTPADCIGISQCARVPFFLKSLVINDRTFIRVSNLIHACVCVGGGGGQYVGMHVFSSPKKCSIWNKH